MPSLCAAKLVFVQGPLAPIPETTILHGTKNRLLARWRCAQWERWAKLAKIVAGFVIVTILTILAERWLSDRAAIAVLVVSLLGFGFLSQQEISQFLVWARANKPATIVGCMAVFAVIGLVIGIRATKDVKPVEAPSPPLITKWKGVNNRP